jgi:hypothetical protein
MDQAPYPEVNPLVKAMWARRANPHVEQLLERMPTMRPEDVLHQIRLFPDTTIAKAAAELAWVAETEIIGVPAFQQAIADELSIHRAAERNERIS